MNTLQTLLTILGGQKLKPGYLTPAGSGTALETVIALKQQFDPFTLLSNPLPGLTNVPYPNILLGKAWVGSLAAGQYAIFLEHVDGNLNLTNTPKPAYIFSM